MYSKLSVSGTIMDLQIVHLPLTKHVYTRFIYLWHKDTSTEGITTVRWISTSLGTQTRACETVGDGSTSERRTPGQLCLAGASSRVFTRATRRGIPLPSSTGARRRTTALF